MPLVLVMHGYTASMYAIAEESRWYDVAEENGFIVVFAQGLVRPADAMGNIPTAMWLAGQFSALAGEDTDPDADLDFIDTLLDRMENDYNIDAQPDLCDRTLQWQSDDLGLWFPLCQSLCGDRTGRLYERPMEAMDSNVLLPTWSFLGEYDSAGDPELVAGGATVTSLQAWNQQKPDQRGSSGRQHRL